MPRRLAGQRRGGRSPTRPQHGRHAAARADIGGRTSAAIAAARDAATWRPDVERATAASARRGPGGAPEAAATRRPGTRGPRPRHGTRGQLARDQRGERRAKETRTREGAVQRDCDREAYYDQGQSALDSARWDRAVTAFDRVIEVKGTKADAALYWKAYAQNKQGQRPEALGTIGSLTKDYPKSRYLSDAKALEVEVKRDSGPAGATRRPRATRR